MTIQRSHAAILLVAFACGCHGGVFAKRQSEENCPTDIRKTVPCYPGEDAIFACPCGPSGNYYGHRPTCWRTWPAPAEVWRDSYCGPTVIEHSSSTPNPFTAPEAIMSAPEPTPAPASDGLGPRVLPPPGTTPPATTPPAAQPAFPGLPPLPGRTTKAKQAEPKFVVAKSGNRPAMSETHKAAAAENKGVETEAASASRSEHESGERPQLVQPVALEANSGGQSEMRLIVSEPLEPAEAALVTCESAPGEDYQLVDAAYAAPVEPSPRAAQSPRRPRPFVTGFVR